MFLLHRKHFQYRTPPETTRLKASREQIGDYVSTFCGQYTLFLIKERGGEISTILLRTFI
jgi:hypothetical protein